MCLLVLFHKHIPGYPLVLCANRDEYLDRPAAPPGIRDAGEGGCRFMGPKDLRAGGTWIGLNEHACIAAVTNRRSGAPNRPDAPSRGRLCAHALAFSGADRMVRAALELTAGEPYNRRR